MPNRMMREGILDSEAVGRLSATAENFFFRCIIAADDAGRLDGRPQVLSNRTYPIAGLRDAEITKRLNECVHEGLAIRYDWLGKPYVQLMKWQRCSPNKVSKFPDMTGSYAVKWVKLETRDGVKEFVESSLDAIPMGYQTHPPHFQGLPVGSTETETETETRGAAPSVAIPSVEEVEAFCATGRGIPKEYAAHYHAKKTETHAWERNGRLVLWQSEIVRWWSGDRHKWRAPTKEERPTQPLPVMRVPQHILERGGK